MSGRLLLLVAMLALLALLANWQPFGSDEAEPAAEASRPGYYLNEVELRDHGQDGQLRLRLLAARAVEEPASGQIALLDVGVSYQPGTASAWQLRADHALAPQDGDTVELSGAVRMTGSPQALGTAELRTERLTLDTERDQASTDDEVVLAFGSHEMRAQGLQADLRAGHVRLEANVHGTFKR